MDNNEKNLRTAQKNTARQNICLCQTSSCAHVTPVVLVFVDSTKQDSAVCLGPWNRMNCSSESANAWTDMHPWSCMQAHNSISCRVNAILGDLLITAHVSGESLQGIRDKNIPDRRPEKTLKLIKNQCWLCTIQIICIFTWWLLVTFNYLSFLAVFFSLFWDSILFSSTICNTRMSLFVWRGVNKSSINSNCIQFKQLHEVGARKKACWYSSTAYNCYDSGLSVRIKYCNAKCYINI